MQKQRSERHSQVLLGGTTYFWLTPMRLTLTPGTTLHVDLQGFSVHSMLTTDIRGELT